MSYKYSFYTSLILIINVISLLPSLGYLFTYGVRDSSQAVLRRPRGVSSLTLRQLVKKFNVKTQEIMDYPTGSQGASRAVFGSSWALCGTGIKLVTACRSMNPNPNSVLTL